ncbi:MAG: excinuclease ABC subunit UvrC [Firmicutes bacterium]|nr:excinuclease ABC subunit UvrC [Bacillota bacterium]
MELSERLLSKLQDLPEKSGVYLFRDSAGQVIYIGKARQLKNRVRQYFTGTQKSEKTQALVLQIADVDYIITLTEKDALSLEANLVKKQKPRYNILLKDDKQYPYIRIDVKQKFPAVEITRKIKNDGAKYFGPYFFGIRAAEVVEVIKSAYRVRCCPKLPQKRVCLNYHINLCLAPCEGKTSQAEYRAAVEKTIAFLSGREDGAAEILNQKMEEAVAAEDFERAIGCRDRLAMIKRLKERSIADLADNQDLDAVCLASDESGSAAAAVVIVRGGKMMGVKNYPVTGAFLQRSEAAAQFIAQYYADPNNQIPPEILLNEEFDTAALAEYLFALSGKKTHFTFPKIGVKKKLMQTAHENAQDFLTKSADKLLRERHFTVDAAERLGKILGVPYPRRIECYDISHLSGTDSVASGVVFTDGKADKKEYRRYKIQSVQGIDDYKSLAEVMGRRFAKKDESAPHAPAPPDLIVIDGGKGQLSAARAALTDTAAARFPIIALAERDEHIFTPDNPEPLILKKSDPALKLLQRVRDEAHRFALAYHHVRRKKRVHSVLEEISGVGPKKRQILLKAFPSVNEIALADTQTLAAVEGIDYKTAQAIAEFFNQKRGE